MNQGDAVVAPVSVVSGTSLVGGVVVVVVVGSSDVVVVVVRVRVGVGVSWVCLLYTSPSPRD